MDQVIEFIEMYWGVTLFGGVTVGAVVMNIWLIIKMYFQNRTSNATQAAGIAAIDAVLKKQDEALYEKAELQLQNDFYQKTTALLFKYINYLTVASKLGGTEKIELVQEAQALQLEYKEQLTGLAEAVAAEAKEQVVEILDNNKGAAISILDSAIAGAGSLLEKYTTKEE